MKLKLSCKCAIKILKKKTVGIMTVWVIVCLLVLTGKPCVMGTSILKRRIRALNRVQTRMGSLGSQNTHPTLERSKLSLNVVKQIQQRTKYA